jgi:hypothetical protein
MDRSLRRVTADIGFSFDGAYAAALITGFFCRHGPPRPALLPVLGNVRAPDASTEPNSAAAN